MKSRYRRQIRGARASKKGPRPAPGEPDGGQRATESVFGAPVRRVVDVEEVHRVDRTKAFPGLSGLHSAFDTTIRHDVELVVTRRTLRVETVTDPRTGRSVRAGLEDVGPARSGLSWTAIATVIQLVVGFALPLNRLQRIIGYSAFSSGKMSALLQQVARKLVPVYLHLAELLADAEVLAGDDTTTKVLDIDNAVPGDEPLAWLDEQFGWASQRADGKGEKKKLNVSMISGRADQADPRATIHFFRTHRGGVGNLLTKILEGRSPRRGRLVLYGDLSTVNLPSQEIRDSIGIDIGGCAAHPRRPMWRYRKHDPALCYYMLSAFYILSRIEHRIDALGRTRETTLRLRRRYGHRVWALIRARALAAIDGGMTSAGRAFHWAPNSELYDACRYIIDNYAALTLYLDDPRLDMTNNALERGLRAEVCMRVTSKFRKTRRGRAALDVLRTVSATCTAAEVSLAAYLREVLAAGDQDIIENPAHYTPHAIATRLAAAAKAAHASAA